MCYLNFIKATGKQGDSSIQCKSQCEEAETIRVLQPLQSVQLEKETDSTSEMKKKGLDPAPTEVKQQVIQLPQGAFDQAATMPYVNRAKHIRGGQKT